MDSCFIYITCLYNKKEKKKKKKKKKRKKEKEAFTSLSVKETHLSH